MTPAVSTLMVNLPHTKKYTLDSSNNFAMAIAVENYETGWLMDRTMFKVVAMRRMATALNSFDYTDEFYELHTCTEKDFEKFSTPENKSAAKLERMKKDGALYCLDWDTVGLDVYGHWATSSDW